MQDYANSLFFTNSLFCSFENLMVKYTFCETIKIHVFAKIEKKQLKMTSSPRSMAVFQNNFTQMFLG